MTFAAIVQYQVILSIVQVVCVNYNLHIFSIFNSSDI